MKIWNEVLQMLNTCMCKCKASIQEFVKDALILQIFLNSNTITHNAMKNACIFIKIHIKKNLIILINSHYLLVILFNIFLNHKWCIHQHPHQKLICGIYLIYLMILNMIFFKSYNIWEIVIKLKLFFNEKHIHVRIQNLVLF